MIEASLRLLRHSLVHKDFNLIYITNSVGALFTEYSEVKLSSYVALASVRHDSQIRNHSKKVYDRWLRTNLYCHNDRDNHMTSFEGKTSKVSSSSVVIDVVIVVVTR